MPIISDRFSKICTSHLFGWSYAVKELSTIKSSIHQAHAEGKMIRFWRTPEDETTWELLLQNGIDWINTDELELLSQFLEKRIEVAAI